MGYITFQGNVCTTEFLVWIETVWDIQINTTDWYDTVRKRCRLFQAYEGIIQELLTEEEQTIPHFKALIMNNEFLEEEGCGIIRDLSRLQFVKKIILSGKKGVASPWSCYTPVLLELYCPQSEFWNEVLWVVVPLVLLE